MNNEHFISLRHTLHANPGISGHEAFAHDLVVKELETLNPDKLYHHFCGFGVVAYWRSENEGNGTIAFRADIDALPIGHCCGHDGHTAIMLLFATMVSRSAKEHTLNHNVLIVFQPEEETGMGAKKIVEHGLLQSHNVKAIFGLHNLPGFPLGQIVLNPGTFAAASTGVVYSLHGRETHASTPEKGINPGVAVAEIIRQFQNLNTSEVNVHDFRQSTLICCRVGEEAFGTSAGKATVMFTLRTFSNAMMDALLEDADTIVSSVAERERLRVDRELREPFAATENNSSIVSDLVGIFEPEMPTSVTTQPFRWSEDFAEYLKVFPGAFFGIGSGTSQHELHHPDYNFPDDLIAPAAHCFKLILNHLNI